MVWQFLSKKPRNIPLYFLTVSFTFLLLLLLICLWYIFHISVCSAGGTNYVKRIFVFVSPFAKHQIVLLSEDKKKAC